MDKLQIQFGATRGYSANSMNGNTYLLIFRHYLLQQQFGFTIFRNQRCPIFPTFRDVKLPTTEVTQNFLDDDAGSF